MGHKILVVDDDEDIRTLFTRVLGASGFEVATAADGDEALSQVAAAPPALVLLDVGMPGKDGYQVLKSLRAESATAKLPVILLTGEEMRREIIEGYRNGLECDCYLTKPVDPLRLVEYIRDRLGDAPS